MSEVSGSSYGPLYCAEGKRRVESYHDPLGVLKMRFVNVLLVFAVTRQDQYIVGNVRVYNSPERGKTFSF